jgi:alpha-glucosidase
LQDPVWERSGYTRRGRDGCRVPLPWEGDETPFGFTSSDARPWLPIPASWRDAAVHAQLADPGSMLSLYRDSLRIRRKHPALGDGSLTWLDAPEGALVFARQPGFVCAVNLGSGPQGVAGSYDVLHASGPVEATTNGVTLPADTAVWLSRSS